MKEERPAAEQPDEASEGASHWLRGSGENGECRRVRIRAPAPQPYPGVGPTEMR
jgi:hypothetical protein